MILDVARSFRASLLLGALAPSVAACGTDAGGGEGGGPGGAVTVAPYTEGSRLRPMLLDAGDGATTFLSFFDQELGLRCWFQATVDGDLRCLPRSHDAWYRDAACSAPVVPAGCLGPEGAILEGEPSDACDHGGAAAAFVPRSTTATEGERIIGHGDGCGPQGDRALLVDADEVPLAAFVRGEVEELTLGAGLGARRIVAEDGATLVTHLLRDGHACAPAELGGELRCLDVPLPRLDGSVELFASSDCTGDRLVQSASSATPTCPGDGPAASGGMFSQGGDPACGGTLFAVGEEVDDAGSAWSEGEGCTAVTAEGPFRRLVEVAPGDLPAMSVEERGTGRVVVRDRLLAGVTAPGGDRPMAELFDTELNVACAPDVDAAGALRCLPRGNGLAWYVYADGDCTQPLFRGDDTSCSGAPDARFATRSDGRSCRHTLGNDTRDGAVDEVLERGAPYDGPVYSLNDATFDCTGGEPAPGYFAVGAVHPAEDFPLLEMR